MHIVTTGLKVLPTASALGYLLAAGSALGGPVEWTKFVKVNGQSEPVPEQWLEDDEARVAHSLALPATVPKSVPFDFATARWKQLLPRTPTIALQYFNHLCTTEAGQWTFWTEHNVEGLYFARPQGRPTSQMLNTALGPEMPWLQRIFMLTSDTAHGQGVWFIQPPLYNYRYIEQPRRDVPWQAGITQPYVRLFGGDGADKLYGGYEADRIFGGAGADMLVGDLPIGPTGAIPAVAQWARMGEGYLDGEDGDDTLRGGAAGDSLFGGEGRDEQDPAMVNAGSGNYTPQAANDEIFNGRIAA